MMSHWLSVSLLFQNLFRTEQNIYIYEVFKDILIQKRDFNIIERVLSVNTDLLLNWCIHDNVQALCTASPSVCFSNLYCRK